MLIQMIQSEISHEKNLLRKLTKKKRRHSNTLLNKGNGHFYYRHSGEKKRWYIRSADYGLLREITSARCDSETIKALTHNIAKLEKVMKKLKNYDHLSIIESLPYAYRSAIEYLNDRDTAFNEKVVQSQNPFRREDLTITCSNGLKVRTREECHIAEKLLELGIAFQYEKALVLTESVTLDDGSVIKVEKTIYPDFTVFLADGSEFYIEHAGLLGDEGYQEDFFKRFRLYLLNDICSPKNLFISMATPNSPINIYQLQHYLEANILPLC